VIGLSLALQKEYFESFFEQVVSAIQGEDDTGEKLPNKIIKRNCFLLKCLIDALLVHDYLSNSNPDE